MGGKGKGGGLRDGKGLLGWVLRWRWEIGELFPSAFGDKEGESGKVRVGNIWFCVGKTKRKKEKE